MKVKIGRWPKLWNVYSIVDSIPFLSEKWKDKIMDYLHDTWIGNKWNEWQEGKKRKIVVQVDPWDTYSLDNTLSILVVPLLERFKEDTMSYPLVDEEDVPESLRGGTKGVDSEARGVARWNWVLDEMIFAFRVGEDGWEDQYYEGEMDLDFESVYTKDGKEVTQIIEGPRHTFRVDQERMKKDLERVQNGFRLFGKYYQNLWS